MSDDVLLAGKVLSGKELDRAPHELRKGSKLKRATAGSVATETKVATKCDDSEQHDEFYTDVLARFGIQI